MAGWSKALLVSLLALWLGGAGLCEVSLRWGVIGSRPENLDPAEVENWGKVYSLAMFDSLFDRIGQELVPVLAEDLKEVSPGVWRLKIREKVWFHDGKELSADDVLFSLERYKALGKAHQGEGYLKKVLRREKRLGRYDVELVTAPDVAEDTLRRLLQFPVLPAHWFSSPEKVKAFERHPIGTGPFRFYRAGAGRLILKANKHYFGGRPRIDELVVRFYPNLSSLVLALISRKVDALTGLPLVYRDLLSRIDAYRVYEAHTDYGVGLTFLNQGLGKDPLIRKVVALALGEDQFEDLDYGMEWIGRRRSDLETAGRLLAFGGFERRGGWWTRDGKRVILRLLWPNYERFDAYWLVYALKRALARLGLLVEFVDDPSLADSMVGYFYVGEDRMTREIDETRAPYLYSWLLGLPVDNIFQANLKKTTISRGEASWFVPMFEFGFISVLNRAFFVDGRCDPSRISSVCWCQLQVGKNKRKGVMVW